MEISTKNIERVTEIVKLLNDIKAAGAAWVAIDEADAVRDFASVNGIGICSGLVDSDNNRVVLYLAY